MHLDSSFPPATRIQDTPPPPHRLAFARPSAEEKRSAVDSPQEGSGLVLVVDDESNIRAMGGMVLESLGYETELVASGAEALRWLATGERTPALALIDMAMPEMDGETLFRHLNQDYPDLPVVMMSGFTREANLSELRKQGLCGFLRKPFTRADLARALDEALSTRSAD